MDSLTPAQEEVLLVIMKSWLVRGKPPTDDEIADRVKVSSVKFHVANLQRGGYVSRDGYRRVFRDQHGNRIKMECRFRPAE